MFLARSSAILSATALQNVYVKATDVPSCGAYMFDGCLALANIFVPRESVEAYKSASGGLIMRTTLWAMTFSPLSIANLCLV